MFEHFGLKDAFTAIWKYKIKIAICAIVITLLTTFCTSFISVKQKPQDFGAGMQQAETELLIHKKQLDFYLEYNGNDMALSSKTLATMYLNTLENSECQQYVANYILSKMSKEEIIQRLGASFAPESITSNFFKQYMRVTVDSTGQAISLWTQSYDPDYSALVLEAYQSWIEKMNQSEHSNVEMVILSETEEILNIPPIQEETIAERLELSTIKVSVLVFVGVLFIGMIISMGLMLFNPTLNRKNDFINCGLKVLGECNLSGRLLINEKNE